LIHCSGEIGEQARIKYLRFPVIYDFVKNKIAAAISGSEKPIQTESLRKILRYAISSRSSILTTRDLTRTILDRLAIGIAHREARDRHRLLLKSIRLMSFTFVPLVAHTKIERKAKKKNKKISSSYGPNISLRKSETLNGDCE